MVARERIVWVIITGVPTHAWRDDIFKTLVQMASKYITIDKPTRKKERFDFGKVLISASSPKAINKIVSVKINDLFYSIRMMEDVFCTTTCNFNSDRRNKDSDESQLDNSNSAGENLADLKEPNASGDSQVDEAL